MKWNNVLRRLDSINVPGRRFVCNVERASTDVQIHFWTRRSRFFNSGFQITWSNSSSRSSVIRDEVLCLFTPPSRLDQSKAPSRSPLRAHSGAHRADPWGPERTRWRRRAGPVSGCRSFLLQTCRAPGVSRSSLAAGCVQSHSYRPHTHLQPPRRRTLRGDVRKHTLVKHPVLSCFIIIKRLLLDFFDLTTKRTDFLYKLAKHGTQWDNVYLWLTHEGCEFMKVHHKEITIQIKHVRKKMKYLV